MKTIIFALVAILILGGGGAGAYFYFQKPAQASVGEAEKEPVKEAEDHGGGHGSGEFVQLDPLILPVIDETGVTQVVSIVVVLEVPDASAANDVKKYTPRLKDAYIQAMYGVLNKNVKNTALQNGVIQVGMLKERMHSISQKVMGPDKISDVLLQVVQQRPL